MWPCFSKIMEGETSVQDKMSYLRMISFSQNMEIQNTEDLKIIEEHITTLINSPMTRYNGLLLWSCALTKSKIYLSNWGKILLAGLQCKDSFAVKEQCAAILKKMVLIFGSDTEYFGAFIRYLPEIIPILLSDSEANQGFVDTCKSLAVCMEHFPQILGSHMVDIESFVMSNLNTDSVLSIEALSDCFAVFPQCLQHKLKPKEAYRDVWFSTFLKTLNTLQSLLNDLGGFQNGTSTYDTFPRFEVPCDLNEGIPLMYNKIRCLAALSRCLAKMMSCETGRVRATVDDLLVLVQRMLNFDFNEQVQVNNQNGELALLILAFPKICDAAFTILEALVLNFSVHEQAFGIMSLVMKAINVSRSQPHASLLYSQVRSTTWKFMNIWIQQSGCRVAGEFGFGKIVNELLIDISLRNTEIHDQVIQMFQKAICMEALRVLNSFLIAGSFFIADKDVEDISTSVIRTIRKIQLHLNPSKTFPTPYSNEECRLELYNLLLTCSIGGNPAQMRCTLKSINLFKIALRDPSIKVKEVCHRAFAVCRYYLHPKKPPPDYTVQSKPAAVVQPIEEDFLSDWESGWRNGHLNGHAPKDESVADHHPSYSMEVSFQESAEDKVHREDSPPHYTDLEPVHSKRTPSQHSERSYTAEEEESESEEGMDEDKESSEDEGEGKPTYSGSTTRANIHVLSSYSTGPREQAAEGHSKVEKKDDSDVEEEDVMVENGEPEESDDVEDEEEEEDLDEDEEEDAGEEEKVESEEPPPKKQKVETEAASNENVEEEEEPKEVDANIETDEVDDTNVETEELETNVETEEVETNVELEDINSEIQVEEVTASGDGNEDINGEIEDSEHSSSNEPPAPVPPEISLTVEEIMSDFVLVERQR